MVAAKECAWSSTAGHQDPLSWPTGVVCTVLKISVWRKLTKSDTIRVTVRNQLQHNGTSIHWHGFRMLNKNIQDGTNGITECALAPGDLKTYEFQATEYGTSVS